MPARSSRQTAIFDPAGLFGLVYWYALWPFHGYIFGGMLRTSSTLAAAAAAFETDTKLGTDTSHLRSSLVLMEEARRVIQRLDRIDALDRATASPAELLAELRGLLHDAEAWVRVEGGDDGRRGRGPAAGGARARCRAGLRSA